MKLAYNPDGGTNGRWSCPACGASFHGCGDPTHKKGCPDVSGEYDNLTYNFTPAEVRKAKEIASRDGEDRQLPLGPVSVALLKQHGHAALLED